MSQRADPRQPDFADLSARVYRLCLSLLGDEADAADAAQEALSRAWSRRPRKRDDVSWWVWAGGFAIRVCRETRRGRAGRVKPGLIDETLPAVFSGESADQSHAALHRAIMALPQRQREMVVLRFLLGLPTKQAAAMLACPAGTVKSNLHKALANLQAALGETESAHELRGV